MRLNELFNAGDLAALNSEGLLDALLTTSPVTTVAIERVLTAVRRTLLNELDTSALETPQMWLPLASALGQQGFLNEYVFDITDEENAQVQKLRDDVAGALERSEAVEPIKVAILASYLPLHTLPGADKLAMREAPEPVAALVAQQIGNPCRGAGDPLHDRTADGD